MDPTMQSPVRVRIPFAGGTEVTLPTGPHYYPVHTWVGRISDGITPQRAFRSLLGHATPFQRGISVNGGTVDIPGLGSVRQFVDPDRLTIVNTTEPGHVLYPGNVHRSIVQDGDDLYVVTHGYGTGIFPRLNKFFAPGAWTNEDLNVLDEVNGLNDQPESMLSPDGYFVGPVREPLPIAAPSSTLPTASASVPFIDEHRQYLNQLDSAQPRSQASIMGGSQPSYVAPPDRSSTNTDIASWMASLAASTLRIQRSPRHHRMISFATSIATIQHGCSRSDARG